MSKLLQRREMVDETVGVWYKKSRSHFNIYATRVLLQNRLQHTKTKYYQQGTLYYTL
jgi:hypothetical protein